jgi:small nuclear ribonucleoprotein E
MNLVIDDAIEVKMRTKENEETRRELGMPDLPNVDTILIGGLGQILLKGDNVALIQSMNG